MKLQTEPDLKGRIAIQESRLRKMEYQHLGLLSVICHDTDYGQATVDPGIRYLGRRIDLMEQRVPIALSLDHQDLLLPAGLPAILPPIRDPERNRVSVDDPIPVIEQKWTDRASGEVILGGNHYMVFRPISTLILLRDSSEIPFGNSIWPRVQCRADHAGRHMTLLFDSIHNTAFFLFGQFQFCTVLGRAQPAPSVVLAHA